MILGPKIWDSKLYICHFMNFQDWSWSERTVQQVNTAAADGKTKHNWIWTFYKFYEAPLIYSLRFYSFSQKDFRVSAEVLKFASRFWAGLLALSKLVPILQSQHLMQQIRATQLCSSSPDRTTYMDLCVYTGLVDRSLQCLYASQVRLIKKNL